MTGHGPSGGDGTLTSYEATVAAAVAAVQAAIANADAQARQVQIWMDNSEPPAPPDRPIGGDPSTL